MQGILPEPQRAEALDTMLKAWNVIAYEHFVDASGRTEWFERNDAAGELSEHYEQTGQWEPSYSLRKGGCWTPWPKPQTSRISEDKPKSPSPRTQAGITHNGVSKG